jgi:hypothetical protein
VVSKFCGLLSSVGMLSLLVGCGGGSNAITYTTFTAPSQVVAGANIKYEGGRSFEGAYTWDTTTQKLTSFSGSAETGSSVLARYGTGSTYAQIVSGTSFTVVPGDSSKASFSFDCGVDSCGTLTADSDYEIFANVAGSNYVVSGDAGSNMDYMLYGIWVTGGGTGSGNVGLFTMGPETSVANIPSTGTATYNGTAVGSYAEADGTDYFVLSDVASTIDFDAGTLTFTNSNSVKARTPNDSYASDTNLNFSGTGSITSGTNAVTGSSTATIGTNITNMAMGGEFFGPNAENLGGIWAGNDPATLEAYMMAFGATQ